MVAGSESNLDELKAPINLVQFSFGRLMVSDQRSLCLKSGKGGPT